MIFFWRLCRDLGGDAIVVAQVGRIVGLRDLGQIFITFFRRFLNSIPLPARPLVQRRGSFPREITRRYGARAAIRLEH